MEFDGVLAVAKIPMEDIDGTSAHAGCSGKTWKVHSTALEDIQKVCMPTSKVVLYTPFLAPKRRTNECTVCDLYTNAACSRFQS